MVSILGVEQWIISTPLAVCMDVCPANLHVFCGSGNDTGPPEKVGCSGQGEGSLG